MKILDNSKITTKVVSLLLMLGVITIGITLFSSLAMNGLSDDYGKLTRQTLPANTDLARMNRRAQQIAEIGYRATSHDSASPRARSAPDDLRQTYEAGQRNLEEAVATDPALADAGGEIQAEYGRINEAAAQGIRLALQNRDAEALQVMDRVDRQIDELSTKVGNLIKARVEANDERSAALEQQANSTLIWLLAIGLIAVAGGVATAIVVARAGITAPLARLQQTMGDLASGNNRVDVPGIGRGDEIGQMAKAVLVFRDAAVELEKGSAEKARADAEQKRVVDTLSEGLASLARGDLTCEIKAQFSGVYEQVKSNFNEAVASLRALIGSVIESSASLRTGAGEIAQASEDLARRTESNAASLEETSAALSQIDERIKASASASTRTVERADQAISTVDGGRSMADEAVQAMGRVSESA
ncbi:HAMP domain-containing protein, partial [Sphingosinicella terrae]|uniref:HAMP domain-containing protein n=1 Tax=Sphingosinicella terrae TaxID=2172047 RepID=UPI0013B38B13